MAEIYSKFRIAFISILLALITACGGGVIITLVEGGISGTGISFGSILAFGSVIVNGTTLDTAQTEIYVDEILITGANPEAALKVGYVIRVDADFDNSRAIRIDYVETVRGPITTVSVNPLINPDTLAGSFEVLGQTIITNALTVFDGIDFATLTTGDVLDVSGVRDFSGGIIARYIQSKTAVTEYRVVGEIAITSPTQFTIGSLIVDHPGIDISTLNNGNAQDGIEVRVKGSAASFNSVAPSLVATSVSDSVLRLGFQTDDSVELEGVVTRFDPALGISDMDVNGFRVNATSEVIEDGVVSDIVLDTLLEVEGSVDSSNILNATKVKIIPISNIRVEALVDSINVIDNSIVVLGQTFQLNEKTQLEDSISSAPLDKFTLNNLSPVDWVEIRGYVKDGNNILTRLERKDTKPTNDVRLQAPVEGNGIDPITDPISLLGITVFTDTNTNYEDVNNTPIFKADFFAAVLEGDLVKARWKNSTVISGPADDLSIED